MDTSSPRTKIVATIGPASRSPEVIREMVLAGMSVARLNFSHGNYEDHAKTIAMLRKVSREMDTPITLLQDLQGPKIRVGELPDGAIALTQGGHLTLLPASKYQQDPDTASIDYPHLAEEAEPGTQIMLDDGLLELQVTAIEGDAVRTVVVKGGKLKSRKGVNLPSLNLQLPSMTDKDIADLEFGLSQGVDWISLSFVREGDDVLKLKQRLADHNADHPVIAKIEKPQAIENLEDILDACDGIMVARGDMGVEVSPERVPMVQKHIIRRCNERGMPVITATQMLESMIQNPRPTRAEASDVANAIVDGTDAVMLSGESAVGAYPVQAVGMMGRIAREVEKSVSFVNFPPDLNDETHAISEALNVIDDILDLQCIVAFTTSGYSAMLAAAERPKAMVVALTAREAVYHRLNLVWGVRPILVDQLEANFEDALVKAEKYLKERNFAATGDRILVMGGIPMAAAGGTNFLKLHRVS